VPAVVAAPPAGARTAPPSAPGGAPATEQPLAETARGGPHAEPGAGKPKTYERLVAEGDRALENGATSKAQKLYEEALKLQPDGVAATTGSAYLLLDRQHTLAAIGLFKRALASAPSFPPALFGLGEAYRAQGENAKAVEVYKRYLAAAPSGQDAPAARRQIRELGDAAATPAKRPGVESARVEAPPDQPGPAPQPKQ